MSTGWANLPPRKFANGSWVKDPTEKVWMVECAACGSSGWRYKRAGASRIWWNEADLDDSVPTSDDVSEHNRWVNRAIRRLEAMRVESEHS